MRNWKQILSGLVVVLLLGVFSCEQPSSSSNDYTVTVSGTVVNAVFSPQDSIILTLSNPPRNDTTKTDGSFNYSFISNEANTVNATVTFHHQNVASKLNDTVISISYGSSKRTINLGVVRMTGDSTVTVLPSLRPGVIVFKGSTLEKISVRGAGSDDATNLTFELKDSLGVTVDSKNKTKVYFNLVTKPDNFTQLNKNNDSTNSAGQVTVQLNSGFKSGIAQIQAYATVPRASDSTRLDTISSPVISVTIAGGLAVQSRFKIGSSKYNIPGLVELNLHQPITAVVGDTFGNPAQAGTVVYFTTNGGIIQPYATSDDNGTVTVDLITGNPIPPAGIATITAQIGTPGGGTTSKLTEGSGIITTGTRDDQLIVKGLRGKIKASTLKTSSAKDQNPSQVNAVFTQSLNILFSGAPIISTADTNFTVSVAGNKDISYFVADLLGNPLTEGTTITVNVEPGDGIEVTGDKDVRLPDTMDRTYTQFKINIKDKRTSGLNQTVPLKLTINVAGDNGDLKRTIDGFLLGTGGVIPTYDSTTVGRIALVDAKPDTMLVSSFAGANRKNIQFRVYNTFGLPARNASVQFGLKRSVGGGEYVTPSVGVTDDQGYATATLVSGVKTGEVHVIAYATRDSVNFITSDSKVINIVIPDGARLASQIEFVNISNSDIAIAGVGGVENAEISYVVKDSLGFPIDKKRRVLAVYDLQFDGSASAGGGTPPSIIPSSDSTDDDGNLTARIVSGTQAGVVTVRVVINLVGRPSVTSTPVKITIHAGFADRGHFSLVPSHYVFAGENLSEIPFTVLVGDTFSNPVDEGTAVYFSSQAGVMQTGNVTNKSGVTDAILTPANPHPDDAGSILAGRKTFDTTYSNGRRGYHWVWAQTRGRYGQVRDSVLVVQSIGPVTFTGIPDTVSINATTHSSSLINFTVKDGRGNPLPDGTTITATVDLTNVPTGFSIKTAGSLPAEVPNAGYARFPGAGVTDFSIRIIDASTSYIPGTSVVVEITVTPPGFKPVTKSFQATVR